MTRPRPDDRRDLGETLVEVVLTMVIIGVAVTALISGLATTAAASTTSRNTVGADSAMRNAAEAIKNAAGTCVAGAPMQIGDTSTDDFSVTVTPNDPRCPDVTTTQTVTIQVEGPGDVFQTMDVVVRTP